MKIFRNPDAKWREEDKFREKAYEGLGKGQDVSGIGTSIILHSGKMHSFNLLGTEIWKLCDGRTVEEIVSELKEKFEVDEETLRSDVDAFLEHLKEEGLVHEK
ncbi:MAG: GeoRSP system PqqD family peptide chaperone [Nitrospiraceae bacterium]|nr:GeoRSP system PqqD family peptide chaperone [Nitrospiraceae bacterium]